MAIQAAVEHLRLSVRIINHRVSGVLWTQMIDRKPADRILPSLAHKTEYAAECELVAQPRSVAFGVGISLRAVAPDMGLDGVSEGIHSSARCSAKRVRTPDTLQLGLQGTHGVRGQRLKLLAELADLLLQLVEFGRLGWCQAVGELLVDQFATTGIFRS
ncbi:MAG: hypothetical protein MUF25_02220 [Pirellulaceae bacterium]|nr:hypothetical protein [Pirellulaceae bacterium]